jgi:hypothetical protein
MDVFTVDRDPLCHVALKANRLAIPPLPKTKATHHLYTPVSKAAHTEAELWMVRLGSPGEYQLDMLPGNATGIPSEFHYHPFRFIDFKEQAQIRKQAAQHTAVRTGEVGRRYYMDFGFMQASSLDYRKPNPKTDRVVQSWDGYSSYLLIVIELRNKNQKQPHTIISVPMIYVGMTSKIKLKVLLSIPMLELQYEY